MATVRKKEKGSYYAIWYGKGSVRHEEATGVYEFKKAQKIANQLEATQRFWEEHKDGTWQLYANMGYSPNFCHESFTHAKHIRLDKFKEMLKDGEVKFKAPNQWRDRPRKKTGGKRYAWKGKRLTLREIVDKEEAQINVSALRWRLDRGWNLNDAVNTPVMSRAEAGTKGAITTNQKKIKK